MKVYIPGSCFLLLILQVTVAADKCEYDWFGPRCQFKCHCNLNIACNSEGLCADNKCIAWHFGPSCQYLNMVAFQGTGRVYPFIKDEDATTCNPDETLTLNVYLRVELVFTWYRIIVNKYDRIRNFTTKLNTYGQCYNERKYVVDSTTVDVTCDTEFLLHELNIKGLIVPSICDVYISMGRNVALKQRATQSSIFEADVKKWGAANAVNDFKNSCAKTNIEESGAEWSITFDTPTRLQSIYVDVENDPVKPLSRATVSLYNEKYKLEHAYTVINITENVQFYTAVELLALIRSITIKQSTSIARKARFLTICEVGIFGDSTCADNKFGFHCGGTCDCKPHEACNYITGACGHGCEHGFYGYKCLQKCSSKCSDGSCNPLSGHCHSCKDNYLGPMCDFVCGPGYFANEYNCTKCSPGCTGVCDVTNGKCSCKSGYIGERCQDCKTGTHTPDLLCINCHEGCAVNCDSTGNCATCKEGFTGPRCSDCAGNSVRVNCNFKCSLGCDHRCNIVGGLCSCDTGFKGPLCSECEASYYGQRCDVKCPEHCLNHICFRANGTCVACESGYIGRTCDENCNTGTHKPDSLCVKCHEGCAVNCDSNTGNCATCKEGFTGLRCSDCAGTSVRVNCNFNCSQGCHHKCNIVDGLCSCNTDFKGNLCSECEASYYGQRCDVKCPEHCLDHICFRANGTCAACESGYIGRTCDENCKTGTPTPDSLCPKCHEGCAVICDISTGYCATCKEGFTGPRCSDCAGTSIRVNCNFNCSQGCDHRCNIVDGLCSCHINFTGPLCSECEASYYGPRCDVNCPEHCLDHICFRANGTCAACESGYRGSTCDESDWLPPEWILALILLSVVMTALCCLFACIKFAHKKSPTSEDTSSEEE